MSLLSRINIISFTTKILRIMPGGFKNISGNDGNKFSSENQPTNRRKSTKFLTDLLTKELHGKEEITIKGVDVETGKPATIRITMPTKRNIVQALLKKACSGDVPAIKEIFDRLEGKAPQALELSGKEGGPVDFSVANLPYVSNEDLLRYLDEHR